MRLGNILSSRRRNLLNLVWFEFVYAGFIREKSYLE